MSDIIGEYAVWQAHDGKFYYTNRWHKTIGPFTLFHLAETSAMMDEALDYEGEGDEDEILQGL